MPDVRRVLTEQMAAVPAAAVGVFLSGGIDSAAILFAARAAGKQVAAYTFALAGRETEDYTRARRVCDLFRVPFRPVPLPADVPSLQRDLRQLKALGAASKTDYECAWPFLHAYRAVTERHAASGMGADGHFCISKKGMIHYRDRIDDFRRGLYANPRYAQRPLHEAMAAAAGRVAVLPYLTDAMRAEFLGTTWDAVNRPRQKQPILDAFPDEFAAYHRAVGVRPHTNLQLGDSGIAAVFTQLLTSDWNRAGHKSVVGVYNALTAGRL